MLGDRLTEFDLIKLLEILEMNGITFSVKSSVNVDHVKKLLESNGWEKVFDEEESELYGNFRVIYRKGVYEIMLFCDSDGYIIEIEITNKRT